MNIGVIGLGKLGLPVAVAINHKGHRVIGNDHFPSLMIKRTYEHLEKGPTLDEDFQPFFDSSTLEFGTLEEVIKQSDITFVAVQTPHNKLYEGTTRIPEERADFDYTHLVSVVKKIAAVSDSSKVVVIISTVLPGTLRREIIPLLEGKAKLVYNPFFIAMGTVMYDFYNPEFVLLGSDHADALDKVKSFYNSLYTHELCVSMSIESAELTKVAYNTFISTKIAYANTLMEICHKIPNCNVDDITKALSKATSRLISPKYMTAGMGDGGGCHPRDNIAMSWLAKKLDLSHDIFTDIMEAREDQAEWLVELVISAIMNDRVYTGVELPAVILGKSFKPDTNIAVGSPAILCANLLEERKVAYQIWDPYIDGGTFYSRNFGSSVFLIATKHQIFKDLMFPEGSIVIDPHRYILAQPGVRVIPVGVSRR